LGMQAVQAEFQADYTRDNVRRGIVGAAEAGRPHAQVTYGYRRIYDSRTKALLRQEPDDEPRTAVGVDGVRSRYTPAGIVVEVVTRLSEGATITSLVRELNVRGVPSPQGKAWTRAVVRKMALNPTYIGKRVLNGEIVAEGIWPPLVDEAMFWAVTRTLTDPARTLTRPGRAVWLLSWLAQCGKCGGVFNSISRPGPGGNGARVQIYRCSQHSCVVASQPELDAYVQAVLVAWLAQPQVYAMLAKATADTDQQAAHVRAESQRLRAELEQWRQAAEVGQVTPVSFARVERGLLERIALADQQAAEAATPPLLRGLVGPDAAAKRATLDTAAKREVIRMVAQISVIPVGKGPSTTPLPQRVQFAGLIAGDQAEPAEELQHCPGADALTGTAGKAPMGP
jgi:site-specific DNA recombinase